MTLLYDPVCPSVSVSWSVIISKNDGKFHFHAPFGALVFLYYIILYQVIKIVPDRSSGGEAGRLEGQGHGQSLREVLDPDPDSEITST